MQNEEYLKKENREMQIKKCIEENYADNQLSVTKIADQFGIHSVYLTKVFKNAFDIGVLEYILKVRFREAKKLLVETELKIEEIAEKVGFASIHTFSRAFKNNMKMSPGEYRKKYRKQGENG